MSNPTWSRREFLGAAALGLGGTAWAASSTNLFAAPPSDKDGLSDGEPSNGELVNGGLFPNRFALAGITDTATPELCEEWISVGLDGMEVRQWNVSVAEARAQRALVESFGLRIHSVMRGWTSFHEPDDDLWNASLETMRTALRAAAAYGADVVLFAPYELKPLDWPNRWEMEIDFDPATFQIRSLLPGDNAPYAASIEKQNRATTRAMAALETLLPDAAREGVVMAMENVRDNFWCTPEFYAAIIRHFDSPWMKSYFDFANHQVVARAEDWLDALGSEIIKIHIKDHQVLEVLGQRGGGPVEGRPVGMGSTDWIAARKKLDDIRYNGWLTLEGDPRDAPNIARVLRAIATGQPITYDHPL